MTASAAAIAAHQPGGTDNICILRENNQ